MKISYAAALGLVFSLAACGTDPGPSGNDSGSGNDVVNTPDTAMGGDTGSGTDAAMGTDAARTDGPTGTDAARTDAATSGAGTCGAAVFTALCRCAAMTDMAAAQMCFQATVQGNMRCLTCVQTAQAMACPTQDTALNTCVTNAQMDSDAGAACTDNACIQMRCASQITAYNTCLRTAAMNTSGTYVTQLNACLGDLNQCP